MISAKQANSKAKHSGDILELKKKIEDKIVTLAENGKFKCEVKMCVDTPVYVRDEIKEWLENLGYRVDMPGIIDQDYERCDQPVYYQDVIIKWQL